MSLKKFIPFSIKVETEEEMRSLYFMAKDYIGTYRYKGGHRATADAIIEYCDSMLRIPKAKERE